MTKASLKQPAAPADIANHAEAKLLLKALRAKVVHARRLHCHAVRALDALYGELHGELAGVPLIRRAAVIEDFERELEPYFWQPPEGSVP